MTVCRHCGVRNPDSAVFCESCGARLREDLPNDPVIIDVTGDEVEVVVSEERPDGSFPTTYVSQARVYVTSSNNRGCLIILVIALLVICCICAGGMALFEGILF